MRAFVTGATGFIGSAVVRCLLARGVHVRALVRPSSDLSNLAGLDVELVSGNLLDEEGLVHILRGCQVLYHVAGYYSTNEADVKNMYQVNVQGTKTVMQAALRAGVGRAVHTSTIGTIGQPSDGSLATEEMPFSSWNTASHYAKSKYLGEVAALRMCEQGLAVTAVNPCAPIGPRDSKPTSTGRRIVDYLHGKIPSFVEGGINFVSVRDVAEGEVLAAEKGRVGERYILGHKEGNLLLSGFLDLMERVSGVKRPAMPRPPSVVSRVAHDLALRWQGKEELRDLRPSALTCDPSKAIRELGLPQTPLVEAFAEAVAWFREHGYA